MSYRYICYVCKSLDNDISYVKSKYNKRCYVCLAKLNNKCYKIKSKYVKQIIKARKEYNDESNNLVVIPRDIINYLYHDCRHFKKLKCALDNGSAIYDEVFITSPIKSRDKHYNIKFIWTISGDRKKNDIMDEFPFIINFKQKYMTTLRDVYDGMSKYINLTSGSCKYVYSAITKGNISRLCNDIKYDDERLYIFSFSVKTNNDKKKIRCVTFISPYDNQIYHQSLTYMCEKYSDANWKYLFKWINRDITRSDIRKMDKYTKKLICREVYDDTN